MAPEIKGSGARGWYIVFLLTTSENIGSVFQLSTFTSGGKVEREKLNFYLQVNL